MSDRQTTAAWPPMAILVVHRHWSWIRALRPRRLPLLALLALAALPITVNWGMFIYAVTSGNTIEAALGYLMTPLVSVVFGILIFRERLRLWQWTAIGISVVAVLSLALDYGRVPWIALWCRSPSSG
ncbi:EamA family transporter [Actinomadura sp. 3N407]|uniref:EamA family transporter n=1 Tax=Actinomadura sp. 3N407 TaxID=3457423 RepID=UPI003FCD6288